MMHMTFYNGVDVTLWVDWLQSSTLQGYMFLVVFIFLFAFGHEWLYSFRLKCVTAQASALPYDPYPLTLRMPYRLQPLGHQ